VKVLVRQNTLRSVSYKRVQELCSMLGPFPLYKSSKAVVAQQPDEQDALGDWTSICLRVPSAAVRLKFNSSLRWEPNCRTVAPATA
jgi:hypothetical protein